MRALPIVLVAAASCTALAQPFSGLAVLPSVPVGNLIIGTASADLDGDGDIDAVVSVRPSGVGQIRVLLNNGRGVMIVAGSYNAGSAPGRPVIADFNNDGRPDVAVPNILSGTVSVLRSNGDGSFQPATTHAVSSSPSALAVADFDSNGFMDIACADTSNNQVRVLLGNGTSFPTTRTFLTSLGTLLGNGPSSIAAGDLNNDGLPDIITGNNATDDIGVYFGSGNGFFFSGEFAYYLDQPDDVYEVELADMDNDNDLDIVASLGFTNAQIKWMRNRYDGGIEPFPNFDDGSWSTTVGGRVVDLAILNLDCNADAFPDVAAASEGSVEAMHVLTNAGSGPLTLRASIPAPGASPQGVAAADFDADGDTDVLLVNLFSGDARMHLNRCQGTNCPADLAAPFGALNFFDISAFITLYNAGNPEADFAAPAGSLNFFDVAAYIAAYNAGCP